MPPTPATLNLNGGTVTPSDVRGGRGFVNFNGGTLRAYADNTNFLAVNTARVYGGGAVIDTNGKNITIGQALLAPTGDGVSATGLAITGGSGYIAPPFVEITAVTAPVPPPSPPSQAARSPASPSPTPEPATLRCQPSIWLAAVAREPAWEPALPPPCRTAPAASPRMALGTLTLSALNGYTGNTTVTGGVLAIAASLSGRHLGGQHRRHRQNGAQFHRRRHRGQRDPRHAPPTPPPAATTPPPSRTSSPAAAAW